MREIPILFSTPMVQSILAGNKTMTRRVVKTQPDEKYSYCHGICTSSTDNKNVGRAGFGPSEVLVKQFIKPPYQPGDRLWVRETWQEVFETEYLNDGPKNIRDCILNFDEIAKVNAGLSRDWGPSNNRKMPAREKYYVFKADDIHYVDEKNILRWRPSIYMPKEAARIWLEVTNVRVERLQEITEEDAKAEGVDFDYNPGWAFMNLWNTINAKRGYGWDANPWAWVVEFRRVADGKQ